MDQTEGLKRESESHCIGTFWTEREVSVIDALSKKQDLSHVATLRQALRNYQLIVEGVPDTGSKLKDETAIPCPKCGQPLKAVEYPSNSPLNRDHNKFDRKLWEAAKAQAKSNKQAERKTESTSPEAISIATDMVERITGKR